MTIMGLAGQLLAAVVKWQQVITTILLLAHTVTPTASCSTLHAILYVREVRLANCLAIIQRYS
jgi:hypothetical protein